MAGNERETLERKTSLVTPALLSYCTFIAAVVAMASCGSNDRRAIGRDGSTPVAGTTYFSFYSDPWINLHHFLYAWAQRDAGIPSGRPEVVEGASLADLSAEDRAAWEEALGFYQDSVIPGGRFQHALIELNRQLDRNAGPSTDRHPTGTVVQALETALPVYLRHWWPRHDRANSAWIQGTAARLRRYEASFVRLTSRLYHADWGSAPWRIDVSAYAPRLGYATGEDHVVIHSTDPDNQQLYGVETLFHEMQHVGAIVGSLSDQLLTAFDNAAAEPPAEIGHALIFLTAGEFVRAAAAEHAEEHTPFWIEHRFEELPDWQTYHSVLREFWLPAVRGEMTVSHSLASIARRLSR